MVWNRDRINDSRTCHVYIEYRGQSRYHAHVLNQAGCNIPSISAIGVISYVQESSDRFRFEMSLIFSLCSSR